jgi:hypothetical protein
MMSRPITNLAFPVVFAVTCAICFGCSQSAPSVDPLKHTGSIDDYRYEVYGHSTIKIEQVPNEAGTGDHPKVTCGSNWFAIQDGKLIVNGKESGAVKRGDTIKLDAQGQAFVNGEKR